MAEPSVYVSITVLFKITDPGLLACFYAQSSLVNIYKVWAGWAVIS